MVHWKFFPGSLASQVLVDVLLNTQKARKKRNSTEAKLKMLLPKLSVLKFNNVLQDLANSNLQRYIS